MLAHVPLLRLVMKAWLQEDGLSLLHSWCSSNGLLQWLRLCS